MMSRTHAYRQVIVVSFFFSFSHAISPYNIFFYFYLISESSEDLVIHGLNAYMVNALLLCLVYINNTGLV
jgi:hypothetical protein